MYVCRAVKAGKGPDYCANTSAVPREELHLAVVAALRKTFSAESFRAHQQRVASDVEAKSSRRQQREHLSIALPQLQAKAGRLAKAVADLDDAGALLAEYEAVQAQVKEAKATIEYLDKADRQDAAQAADVAQLEATWSDWVTKLDQDPGLARQVLRKVLGRPSRCGQWARASGGFPGFSRFDAVLAGGLSKGAIIVEHRDVKTETGMLQWLASALGIEGVQPPAGRRTLRVLEAEDGSSLPPISGGSDADSVGSNVRATDMAPQAPPPTLGPPRQSRGAPR